MKKITALTVALVSGVFLGCAYPPVGFGFLAYASLVPILWIITKFPSRHVFILTFVSGLAFHGFTLFWIRHITWVGMIALVITLSLIYTLPFLLTRFMWEILHGRGLLLFPFAIAGIEWIRSFDVLAFPWMILANSQTYYPRLIQFADITSAFGVSWWVAMVNVSIFFLVKKRTIQRWAFLVLLFIFPLLYSLKMTDMHAVADGMVKVALIQGNVTPEEKWGVNNEIWNINLYRNMSIEAMAYNPDLVIWPETATPVYLGENPLFRRMVQTMVDSIGVPVLTGTPSIDFESEKKWNSAVFFTPGEETIERYDKIHLVPFGEAIPFHTIFPSLKNIELGQANWDAGTKPVVFNSPVLPPFSAVICFESIFPDLIRKFVTRGAQFIAVITNDVWFGPYASPIQHAMISVLRAIEFHLPVVRCANTGISMIIDPYGRIVEKTETFERDILIGTIKPGTEKTFYAKFGNVFSLICFLISIISCMYYMYVKYSRFARIA